MARIRTIKPDFWTDEKLSDCSIGARLLFIGTWNFADDNGNLPASAKKLKMQIFPADNVDCLSLLNELIIQGVLSEYSVSGEKYLHIKGFKKHQVINRPSKTAIPEPIFIEDSLNTHGVLIDGKEGKGREIEGNKHIGVKFEPTLAGIVCKAMKDKGVQNVNPSHPGLLALIEAGATAEEFANMVENSSVKTFTYILGAVRNSRKQAAEQILTKGALPVKESQAWRNNETLMVAKAKELGIGTEGKTKFELLARIDEKLSLRKAA